MPMFLCVSAIVACLDFFGNPLLNSWFSLFANFSPAIFSNFMSGNFFLEVSLPWGSSHAGCCLCWVCVVGVTRCTGGLLPLVFTITNSLFKPIAIFWNLSLVIPIKNWHGPHLSCLMPFLWSSCFYVYIFFSSTSRFSLWIFGTDNSRTFDLTSEEWTARAYDKVSWINPWCLFFITSYDYGMRKINKEIRIIIAAENCLIKKLNAVK